MRKRETRIVVILRQPDAKDNAGCVSVVGRRRCKMGFRDLRFYDEYDVADVV